MSVTETMKTKLEEKFAPTFLEIINESHMHAGHMGDDGTGESHFQLTLVSNKFDGVSRVQRQRMVYEVLAHEMKNIIHALALKTLTPTEYANLG